MVGGLSPRLKGWGIHTSQVSLKEGLMSSFLLFFLTGISPLWTVPDGVGPLLPFMIVTIQYNCHRRDLHYTTFTVRNGEVRRGGFKYYSQTISLFVIGLGLTPCKMFYGLFYEEFCQFQYFLFPLDSLVG